MTAAEQGKSLPEIPGEARLPDQRSVVLLAEALRKHLLLHQQMGIHRYPRSEALEQFIHQPRRRRPTQAPARRPPVSSAASSPRNEPINKSVPATPKTAERRADLNRELAACSGCNLATSHGARILGRGKEGAGVLIVGDYARSVAGESDDCLFGRAEDELLWKMMQAINLGPGDVYVTNVVKCSPIGGATPAIENEQACLDYLHREIALVQPKIILAMGLSATRAILGAEASVFRCRGRLHLSRFLGKAGAPIPVIVSFHPQLLLEQPAMKKAAWQDLQKVQWQLQAASKAPNLPR
ncbi:MAG: uracil-DNA glycosylase [Desulfobulbus sp.]